MVILEPGECGTLLPRGDRREEHIRKVLKKRKGDRVLAGIAVDEAFGPAPGTVGEALVERLDEEGLVLRFAAFEGPAGEPPPLAPIRLLLGFPRPIQANRLFKDLTSLGIAELSLSGTELGEKSYLESDFFRKREFRRPLIEGAEQAANPRLPRVATFWTLDRCLAALDASAPLGATPGTRILLHPGDEAPRLGALEGLVAPLCLAVGSERGWTARELALLEAQGFRRAGLGTRILKSETAALAAVSVALSRIGLM